jgi:autotransporter-associated beta strand protein
VFTSNQLNVVERDVSVTGTGTLTLAKGTLQLGNGGTTGTINGGTSFNLATTGGTLAFKRSDDFTYSGVISGAAGLTQAGAGNLTLTGVNTYTGATTVSAGTLTLAGSATFGSGAITLTGGLLNLGGRTITNTVTVNGGSLAGGSINLSQMTISSGTVSANLTGSASYTKAGAGAVTLSGNNTYTGSTVVNAGTLTAGSNNAFSTGNLTVNAGATLGVGAGVTLANNVTLSGATTILANGGILSGVLSGTGSMTKTGTGSLTLTGNNTFTGGTVVQSGTLRVDGVLAGTVTINTGGKLGGTGRMNGGVSVQTGGSVGAGGVAPSALTLAALELRNGASLELKIVDGAGSAGVGFDRYLVTGALDLSAASLTDRVTLRLSGLPTNFNAASNLTFTFLDYGSLNLGAASNITDLFAINTDNLFDQNGNALSSGSFSLINDTASKQLSVAYTSPIPEPSTYGLSLGALGLGVAMVRRRRRQA